LRGSASKPRSIRMRMNAEAPDFIAVPQAIHRRGVGGTVSTADISRRLHFWRDFPVIGRSQIRTFLSAIAAPISIVSSLKGKAHEISDAILQPDLRDGASGGMRRRAGAPRHAAS